MGAREPRKARLSCNVSLCMTLFIGLILRCAPPTESPPVLTAVQLHLPNLQGQLGILVQLGPRCGPVNVLCDAPCCALPSIRRTRGGNGRDSPCQGTANTRCRAELGRVLRRWYPRWTLARVPCRYGNLWTLGGFDNCIGNCSWIRSLGCVTRIVALESRLLTVCSIPSLHDHSLGRRGGQGVFKTWLVFGQSYHGITTYPHTPLLVYIFGHCIL